MKISAGSLRGRSLVVTGGVRPTSGRSREALFSRWQQTIVGCSFLDLFAGSGGMALEAVSRGALEAVLVERDRRALSVLRRNCELLAAESCIVLCGSLPELPEAVLKLAPFGHIFADPPYDFRAYTELLRQVAVVLARGGEAAIEHSSRLDLEPSAGRLVLTDSRKYGDSQLSFYAIEEP